MKYNPCDMGLINKSFPEYTVTEVLREIYRKADTDEIRTLCRIAVTMVKAMSSKLTKLDPSWSDNFWEKKQC